MSNGFDQLVGFIWNIANKLRGPYKPPQYRLVMLPMTVLRRMDCVLEPTKDEVLEQYEKLQTQGHSEDAIHKILGKYAAQGREQAFYNISKYTFKKLLGDPDNIARNLVTYIDGFSPKAKEIFEKFEFEQQIEKLDKANRLFLIVKEFADLDLHPDHVDNLQMGYVFEELVRKFNEQANEEAGDHFTPREVIRLMAHLVYTSDEDVYTPGIARTIYDPTCGTGGMLSVSEEYIREQNPQANLLLFGQEYNPESYAICCSDLLIKDEPVDHIIFGDTLGDGKTSDGHPDKHFHYMLANPPFGVEWKTQQSVVEKEYTQYGFKGRFGPGTPRINDGALLFLLHMMSKMHPSPEDGGEGSKIAIVFNGSPLFTGDAGSGESNIRRWIIENDYLDAIIALPDQMFYNTGIYTYIWLVSNRKRPERKGCVQLIDATRHFQKMRKSLGNKRNELSDEHINEITRLYARFEHDDTSKVLVDGQSEERICSKIFNNHEFGYLKITVERPLRLNFQASPDRIESLKSQAAFSNLAESKKRKDNKEIEEDIAKGEQLQQAIISALESMDSSIVYKNRDDFSKALVTATKTLGLKLDAPIKKAIFTALGERDETAEICRDSKGHPEADGELRDTELVPLPKNISLPLPIGYDAKADNNELLELVREHCEEYLKLEVLPHVPDAWIDHSKTKVGYEIPLNRHFYVYQPPRPLEVIESDIKQLEQEILQMLKGVVA
ncbi:Type I restriction enzyme EcoKI M protein [Legionella pneumophila]|uniref:type I restriction-modification system subunit M n=1 Tax=Legionella pneumophila TaxID=446 RepID=UPI0007706FF5|nr:class I SAM-dependent DNA methyltransferase [Legionella pneumophila]MCH9125765.1 SAM-dependent DNA methyltransferase [Legionella pneumophila serogroup 1]MCH9161248.1 SAM-dependent DNA methyltransferase [Legionella pneumophila serogroup 1]MCH9167572.1 SAM-dependent DNA methyltransferase [Legionella pneumophila serogroup 1]MCH9176169.1 SAM-dependent DNA methyltransferase [Legionella pneumophila serogroup 1]MCH9179529.1 SAM-dependent DNA methyltransferase [Legionella pneumophila serogroup 1]